MNKTLDEMLPPPEQILAEERIRDAAPTMLEALAPFAHFADVFLSQETALQPTTGEIYSINRRSGEASITVEMLKAARAAIAAAKGETP